MNTNFNISLYELDDYGESYNLKLKNTFYRIMN